MAAKTGTYTLIASNTLTTSTATVTFSSIPSTYTDLVLVYSAKSASTTRDMTLSFNSDSNTNYSNTILTGYTGVVTSVRNSNQSFIYLDNNGVTDSTIFNAVIVHIPDYSNSTTYKTILCRANNTVYGVDITAGLWRSTAAISAINLTLGGGINLASGSTFKLYGIEAGNL